jgi:hypothetical protein
MYLKFEFFNTNNTERDFLAAADAGPRFRRTL